MGGAMTNPQELADAVRSTGSADERLLAAIRAVPRAEFVAPEVAARAYFDEPLPIAHAQVTTQPSLVARMVGALELRGDERVLEIGTGSAWQTALIAKLVALVWSVERWSDLAQAARDRLQRLGVENAEIVLGDGTQGLAEHAPYDAIVVSAAYPSVPDPLASQLAEGGRLVQPLGRGGAEDVVLFVRERDQLARQRVLTGARFVRLVGRHGFRS
jgi:protein-L-isoaspartate(D-aspartate) O-methyltransferase